MTDFHKEKIFKKKTQPLSVGFGPKNGVQATSSSSRGGTLLHLPLQEKHFQCSGGGTASYSSNRSHADIRGFRHSFTSNDSLSMQKLTKKTLSHRTCKHLKSTHGLLRSTSKMQRAQHHSKRHLF